MDRKVAEYLDKPIKQRSKRTVNANDDLVTASAAACRRRAGWASTTAASAPRRIEVAGLTGDAEVDESDRDVSDADVRKLQYDEFEKLAQRDGGARPRSRATPRRRPQRGTRGVPST